MKIKKIITKADETIETGKFTVLVGPNNVGKSRFLRDIHDIMQNINAPTTIIKEIIFEKPPTFNDLTDGLRKREHPQNSGLWLIDGISSDLRNGVEVNVPKNLETDYDTIDIKNFLGTLSKLRVALLDAESRLLIAKTAPSTTPNSPPQNLLQALFQDRSDLEESLQSAFSRTFGIDIKLDPSGLVEIAFRVAKEFDAIPPDIRDQYQLFQKYQKLDTQGDGFRSFIGVVLSVLLSNKRIILLDEPEAFLHPTQARILGNWISEYSTKVDSQIFISTHNANFLAGVLSGSNEVDIFRLGRIENNTYFNKIASDTISQLTKSPLLSSQPVYESIFYNGVVVCEADSDRIFYQKVALKEFKSENVLFVHAHNKQTIKNVVNLLKNVGVPVATIIDIDILNSEDNFKQLLTEFGNTSTDIFEIRNKIGKAIEKTPDEEILKNLKKEIDIFSEQLARSEHKLSGARGALDRITKLTTKWDNVKKVGLSGIPMEVQCETKDLMERTKKLGIFLVPKGELESWIDVGTRQKNKWIVNALSTLNEKCPCDLKSFIREVLVYLKAIDETTS